MQDGQGGENSSPQRGVWPPPPGEPGSHGTEESAAPGAEGAPPEFGASPVPGGPAEPADSQEPGPAAQPAAAPPGTPIEPGTPGQPGTPLEPGAPLQPGTPMQPGTPGQPGSPTQPGSPEPWAPPLPADQGTWILPGTGQGTWGPPPRGPEGQAWGAPAGPEGQAAWGPPPAPLGQGPWGSPPGGGYGQPPGPLSPARPSRLGRGMIFAVVAVLAAALGAGAVLALQHSSGSSPNASSQGFPTPGTSAPGNGNGGPGTSAVVSYVTRKVKPGMVDITSKLRFSGQVFEGTGMILSPSGLVLTNNHVVNGATALTATLVSSGRRFTAQVVGTDSAADVALLKLKGASGLRTVQVGNSSKVSYGTPVVALGNAGGSGGAPTVTSGTITALNRTITASDAGSGTSETLHGMLQTNAPIAEGDSGGPLANRTGQVIGMDTAANTHSLGAAGTDQGFAIPINRALSIVRQIASGHGGGAIHLGQPAFLGIEIASASPSAASTAASPREQLRQLVRAASRNGGAVKSSGRCLPGQIGNPVPARVAPVGSGTLVASVFCNAPASSVGMLGGDVITAVNGHRVTSPASLTGLMLSRYHPGNTVSVSWVDTSGRHHTSSITLAAGPAK